MTSSNADRLPSKGDFGWAALASGRQVIPAEWVDPRPHFGLQREAGYLWGTLRDDHGDPLSFARRLPDPAATDTIDDHTGALPDKLIVAAAWDGAGEMVLRKEPKFAVPAAEIERRLDGGQAIWRSAGDAMRLSLGSNRAEWSEHDLIEVAGPQVGPGLQWYLPGPDAAIYYPTTTWQVTGTVFGRDVSGFLFYEEAYVPPGGRLYVHHDPLLGHQLHTTWYSWANRYADGDLEFGHFLFGHDRFAIGIVANGDGEVRVAEHMEATVTRASDGYWSERIDFVLDGEEWEMVADPAGHMVAMGQVPNPQQEGVMRRKGETRDPVVWMAWGETVPTHGEVRRIRRSLLGAPLH